MKQAISASILAHNAEPARLPLELRGLKEHEKTLLLAAAQTQTLMARRDAVLPPHDVGPANPAPSQAAQLMVQQRDRETATTNADRPTAPQSEPGLPDYQFELMVVEQRNAKRLRVRQEGDTQPPIDDESAQRALQLRLLDKHESRLPAAEQTQTPMARHEVADSPPAIDEPAETPRHPSHELDPADLPGIESPLRNYRLQLDAKPTNPAPLQGAKLLRHLEQVKLQMKMQQEATAIFRAHNAEAARSPLEPRSLEKQESRPPPAAQQTQTSTARQEIAVPHPATDNPADQQGEAPRHPSYDLEPAGLVGMGPPPELRHSPYELDAATLLNYHSQSTPLERYHANFQFIARVERGRGHTYPPPWAANVDPSQFSAYELQLALLDEQNKLRLLMARQEMDAMSARVRRGVVDPRARQRQEAMHQEAMYKAVNAGVVDPLGEPLQRVLETGPDFEDGSADAPPATRDDKTSRQQSSPRQQGYRQGQPAGREVRAPPSPPGDGDGWVLVSDSEAQRKVLEE